MASLDESLVQKLNDNLEIVDTYKIGLTLDTPWELGGQGPVDLVHEGDNIWVAINWRHTVSKISAGGEVTSDYPVDGLAHGTGLRRWEHMGDQLQGR